MGEGKRESGTKKQKAASIPFDWNSKSTGFGEIMANGGFDVVIGNPPYVRIQTLPREQVASILLLSRLKETNHFPILAVI